MLSESTKKRIKERKVLKHSNPMQFLKRIREQSKDAIEDLTFLANNLEEEESEKIFTKEKLGNLFYAIMNPPRNMKKKKHTKEELDRKFKLAYMFTDSSIDIIGHSLNNIYAERLYQIRKKDFMDILHLIYSDKVANKI